MGFRSTFVTQDIYITWPEWFVKKYSEIVYFRNNHVGSISSKFQGKCYGAWEVLNEDIQHAIDWSLGITHFVVIYLHECGGITRAQISKDSIKLSEPSAWQIVDEVAHDYCYGCSDV